MKLQSMAGIAVSAAAMAVLASGCAMLDPRQESYVAPPLGTAYAHTRTDTGSFGSGTSRLAGKRGERMWKGRQMVTFESPEGTIVSRPEGGFVEVLVKDSPVTTWDPPASYEWPLYVGKSWKQSYRMTLHAANRTISYTQMQRIEAYEDVTVPAGTFKAFRITSVDTTGQDNVQWFSPELGIFVKQSLRRTASHPQGPGTREVELVSYTRGK